MNEQQFRNAIAFIEIGARAMASQEPDLTKSGRVALAGADVQVALRNLYESQPSATPSLEPQVPEANEA